MGLISLKVEHYKKSEDLFLNAYNLNPDYQLATVCGCFGDIYLLVNKNPQEALKYFNGYNLDLLVPPY